MNPELKPQRKVTAAGLGGAIAIVAVWTAGQFGLEVPPEVAAAVSTIFSFVAGYLVKS